MDKLKNVPITIALFEQNEKSSVVPGNFISYTNIDKNSNNIGKWTNLDEEYFLFPSAAAERKTVMTSILSRTLKKMSKNTSLTLTESSAGRSIWMINCKA